MGNWTRNVTLIYPVGGLTSGQMDAVATAYATVAALETFANERLMFTKSLALSTDYGTTETHRSISSAMTETLWAAAKTALSGATGTWYLLDANNGALLDTNDTAKKFGASVTKQLDWAAGVAYAIGEVVRYQSQIYAVIQAHTSQSDWTPPAAPALFKRYIAPGATVEWFQPVGAHDAWPVGARVTYAGKTWENTIPANVWTPGVTGWTQEGDAQTTAWVSGEQGLKVGDRRTYGGFTWEVIQPPGVNIWSPDTVPALWKKV